MKTTVKLLLMLFSLAWYTAAVLLAILLRKIMRR